MVSVRMVSQMISSGSREQRNRAQHVQNRMNVSTCENSDDTREIPKLARKITSWTEKSVGLSDVNE